MKLMMHILRSNPREKIDNEKANFEQILSKLDEEHKEVVEAANDYVKCKSVFKLRDLVSEVFDLIQVCILLLWKCHRQADTLDVPNMIFETNIAHKDKLASRGWIIKTGIEIDIKE